MMVFEHDYKKFPELTNRQIEEFGITSPHEQITMDFEAVVVKVHDGDTIRLKTVFRDFDFPLRLLDMDAKEINEGGEVARDWLKGKILNENIEVKIRRDNRVDKYGRLLGSVFYQGIDMTNEMIRLGLATTFINRREGQIPNLDKVLSIKQWL